MSEAGAGECVGIFMNPREPRAIARKAKGECLLGVFLPFEKVTAGVLRGKPEPNPFEKNPMREP